MTTINHIKTASNGTLEIRMKKSDGGWHRTVLEPGTPANEQLAMVNKHLKHIGITEIASDEWQKVRDVASKSHTAKVIQDYRDLTLLQVGDSSYL